METKYCILNTDDLHFVDYDKIMQTSYASLRFSPDKEKFIIKYKGDQPRVKREFGENRMSGIHREDSSHQRYNYAH